MTKSSPFPRSMITLALAYCVPVAWSFGASACRHHKIAPLHATSIEISSSAWKPCAQPRFDEFASRTVGPWTATNSIAAAEVEEVMRSCGGAIQGIRELPLSMIFDASSEEDRTYHNRADGGFVYGDDGSYTAGPTKWDWNEETADGDKLLMASLAFPDARRAWITVNLTEASEVVARSIADTKNGNQHQLQPSVLELYRPVSSSQPEDNDTGAANLLDPSQLSGDVTWKVIQRARMSKTSDPWTLARAKWEKLAEDTTGRGDTTKLNNENAGSIIGLAFLESFSDKQHNALFGDVARNDLTHNVHMMAVCTATKVARSAVRCYDSDGLLKSVALLEGVLKL